jgi:Ca-activated chloride channel homolog
MVQFEHPQLFSLFIFVGLFLIINYYFKKRDYIRFQNLANDHNRKFLFNRVQFGRIKLRTTLFILGTCFMILAAIGPQIGTKLTELKREGVDLIIALDISTSMDAVDVKPTRLEKAKYELSRLINSLNGDRVGLIVFAGTAHLHLPLTTDYAAARLFLQSITTELISTQGTDLSSALTLAMDQIIEDSEQYKVVVIVSDGEDHQGNIMDLTQEATNMDVMIHTLGIGTSAGGPIPILDEYGNRIEFKKDRNGNIVTTKLNDAVLNEIAYTSGGKYIRIENQANAIMPLLEEIDNMEKREIKAHVFSQYENRYRLFLLLAIICFLIEFFIPTRSSKELAWEGRFHR